MPKQDERLHQHRLLLLGWARETHHDSKNFIWDGPIDPDHWFARNRRVVFLLKEAYDRREQGFDLCNSLATKSLLAQKGLKQLSAPSRRMWWTVARWAFAVLHGTADQIPRLADFNRESALDTGTAVLPS